MDEDFVIIGHKMFVTYNIITEKCYLAVNILKDTHASFSMPNSNFVWDKKIVYEQSLVYCEVY